SPDGKLAYAVEFPFEFYTDVKPIQVDSTGSALLVSNLQVLKVAPDGSSVARTPLPDWAQAATCAGGATGSFVCGGQPWACPRRGRVAVRRNGGERRPRDRGSAPTISGSQQLCADRWRGSAPPTHGRRFRVCGGPTRPCKDLCRDRGRIACQHGQWRIVDSPS